MGGYVWIILLSFSNKEKEVGGPKDGGGSPVQGERPILGKTQSEQSIVDSR
jgi:hypothetical protein